MSTLPAVSLRDIPAFLRDPAVFTGGRGLELGDVYRVRVPGYRIFVVTDPGHVERILVREADCFVKGTIYWRELRRTIGDSIGSLDGDRWEYLHGLERPHFTPRAARSYAPDMVEGIHRTLAVRRDGGAGEEDVLKWLAKLNARLMIEVLCGRREEPEAEEIVDRIRDGHEIIAWRSSFPWRPLTAHLSGVTCRTAAHARFFDEYMRGLESDRAEHATESSPEQAVLLDTLLRITRDPDAPAFSDALPRNEIVFHLGASTETLAASEGWALYLLWKHPQELERVREELGRVCGDDLVGEEDVPALHHLQRVVKETLRLFPPVYGIVRDASRPFDLNGAEVRPGDTVLISVYAIHRNPRLWTEPDRFEPDRFLAEAQGRYRYLPFGAGRHVCLGQHLATPAMVLTLARCAQMFDWCFHDKDVRPEAKPSLKPSGAFRATFTPRGSVPDFRPREASPPSRD